VNSKDKYEWDYSGQISISVENREINFDCQMNKNDTADTSKKAHYSNII